MKTIEKIIKVLKEEQPGNFLIRKDKLDKILTHKTKKEKDIIFYKLKYINFQPYSCIYNDMFYIFTNIFSNSDTCKELCLNDNIYLRDINCI